MCYEKFEHKFFHCLYYFIVYSFFGWCMETVYMSLRAGHLVNRGFLYGPFCPIYGFGALILIMALGEYINNRVKYFFYAAIGTTILEFIVGVILKLAFNKMWWDYSEEPFNIAGLICLKSSITWGFLSLLFMNVIHPHIHKFITSIPVNVRKSISYFFILYLLVDCTSTITSITDFNGLRKLIGTSP